MLLDWLSSNPMAVPITDDFMSFDDWAVPHDLNTGRSDIQFPSVLLNLKIFFLLFRKNDDGVNPSQWAPTVESAVFFCSFFITFFTNNFT